MASPENVDRRNWADLPREVTASILSRVPAVDTLTSAQFVCKLWLEVSKDPFVWKTIDMHNSEEPGIYYDKLFRNAVNRSCAQAVDIIIELFADDERLRYVAERCSQIKRLRLIDCSSIDLSGEGLIEAVEKLPELEELELTLSYWMNTGKTIEEIGRKCPSLKSFNTKSDEFLDFDFCDLKDEEDSYFNRDAVAIGKTMPGLKNLQLINNSLTIKGLRAILDGCLDLESLDLRKCLNVSLSGKVWERCVNQVKVLRLPKSSPEDYPYRTSIEVRDGGSSSDFDCLWITRPEPDIRYGGSGPYFHFDGRRYEDYGDYLDHLKDDHDDYDDFFYESFL